MSVPVEVLQNIIMRFGPVAKYAQRYHSTGVNADPGQVRRVFERYRQFAPVAGKDILEIGPGHTLEVLECAKTEGARNCTAIDVVDYRSPEQKGRTRVIYALYDGKTFPLEDACVDLIWSYTAFEHLRYPAMTVQECFRVLRPGGMLMSLIDLGDHSFYGMNPPHPDKLFHCLRYPEWLWNLMRWNRSSYVNRLRQSDWVRLFTEAGFVMRVHEATVSDHTVRFLPQLRYLHKYHYDDAVTSVLTVCMEKPALSGVPTEAKL
ncbi:MAG: class I SAM-dependent methyltransferase [Nitrospira sp.]|nr:MAG: class I SAM-dependent methyltransferase [Nitrospira sp.]